MRLIAALTIVGATALWAAPPADAQQDPIEDLLRVHAAQRTAHVLGDEALLTEMFAPDFVEIGRGSVRSPSSDAARARFGHYFDSVRFLEWEDVRPPRVRLSSDGIWAEVLVEKRVRTIPADPQAASGHDARYFAWVGRWERTGDVWRLGTLTSTDRPAQDREPARLAARVRAYEILRRAREALGGEAAVARVATLRFIARCEGPNGPFVTEVRSARDGRVSFTQRFASSEFAAGIDLAGAWTGPEGTSVDSLGGVLTTVVAAHEMHLLAIAPAARYSDPVALPPDVLDGRPVDIVQLTDPLGAPVHFYFDTGTGRPAGFRPVNHTGRGAAEILTRFDDWRPVGDILLPHTLRIDQGEDRYRYQMTGASTEWLDDSAFRPRPER